LGRHVALLSYEGGQQIVARRSLAAGDQRLALAPEAVLAYQVHPDMYQAYRDLLDGCRNRGMELFVAFDFVGEHTPADTFGVLQYLDESPESAPKYRALIRDWVTPGAAPKAGTGGQR